MKPVRASLTSRLVLGGLALVLLTPAVIGGCDSSLDPKECMKIREEAFEMVNKAQHCNNDSECRQSDWPGCPKPLSMETYDKIKPSKESFTKGKCQDPKSDPCRDPPEVYCKQGLCVHREKGTPEGAGNTPTDQIIIQ